MERVAKEGGKKKEKGENAKVGIEICCFAALHFKCRLWL